MATSRGVARFSFGATPKTSERITRATETSTRETQPNVPQANVGIPVVSILGRKKVDDANSLWLGNLIPLTQTTITSETRKEGDETIVTQVQTTEVVGYLADLHTGICLGPGVKLRGVYIDGALVWSGSVGPVRTTFTLNPSQSFISECSCVFSGGAFDQAPEPLISQPDYPGYVGIATILIRGIRLDQPMGNIAFEVERFPNPLGLTVPQNELNGDINVASALVELLTNEWGLGTLDLSQIDVDQFESVAIKLQEENNYCAIKIGQETSVAAVIKALQEQGNLVVYQNPDTGKVTCQIINSEDIDYSSLINRFSTKNVISIQSFQKTGWKDTINQVVANYVSRENNYAEVSIIAQNKANLDLGRKTAVLSYPYVSNKELARFLLSRDGAQYSAPVIDLNLLTTRDGANCVPGTVIFLTWPDYNLVNEPFLVLTCRRQPISDNNVVLQTRQLRRPGNFPFFIADDEPVDLDLSNKTITAVKTINAPYAIAAYTPKLFLGATLDFNLAIPLVLPTPGNELQIAFDALKTGTLVFDMARGLYPTIGKLNGLINKYDAFDTGLLASMTIDDVINPIHLRTYTSAEVLVGSNAIFINGEILTFEDAVNLGGGSWRLDNVQRAMVDTVFEAHADNSDVYIIGIPSKHIAAPIQLPASQAYDLVSQTLIDRGFRGDTPTNVYTTPSFSTSENRIMAPARPHDTKIAGVRSSSPATLTIGTSTTVTWKRRSRVLFPWYSMTTASEGGEAGQDWRVWHRQGATLTALAVATGSNTSTFTMPTVGLGAGFLYIESKRGTYTSLYRDELPVNVV